MGGEGSGACAVCEAQAWEPLWRQVHRDFERCRSCGFVQQAEAPSEERLESAYAEMEDDAINAWEQYEENLGRFDRYVGRIERWVPRGRLLDVGCSIGTSLVAARARGWDVAGVELGLSAARFGSEAFGVDIRTEPLNRAGFEPESFDALLMHHTLEHVRDPAAILAEGLKLLRPGGVMYQILPNYGSLKRLCLGQHWGYGVTRDHLLYFTPKTLARLCRRLGFEALATDTNDNAKSPRLVYDFARRFGQEARLMKAMGRAGRPFDPQRYLEFVESRTWTRWVNGGLWPARLARVLGRGEELHLLARRPDGGPKPKRGPKPGAPLHAYPEVASIRPPWLEASQRSRHGRALPLRETILLEYLSAEQRERFGYWIELFGGGVRSPVPARDGREDLVLPVEMVARLEARKVATRLHWTVQVPPAALARGPLKLDLVDEAGSVVSRHRIEQERAELRVELPAGKPLELVSRDPWDATLWPGAGTRQLGFLIRALRYEEASDAPESPSPQA